MIADNRRAVAELEVTEEQRAFEAALPGRSIRRTAAPAGMRAQGGNELLVAGQGGTLVGCLELVVIRGLIRTRM